MFGSVAIVGLGLIGGSMAAAIRGVDPNVTLYGIDIDPAAIAYAAERHLVDAAAQPEQALRAGWFGPGVIELVVLAAPASEIATWLSQLERAGFDGIVTDVASTKGGVMAAARDHAHAAYTFVGGHPMAGSERSGVEAADADLFRGAYYVLTPSEDTDADAFSCVHDLVTAIGARAISIPADIHDSAVALVSHVPHLVAAALVTLAAEHSGGGQDALRLAAGGFKDMTRVAAGSPDLWTGICTDNAEPIVAGLVELRELLRRFVAAVEKRDAETIRSLLTHAADVRRALPAQWVPATSALSELTLAMIDRPGQVSEITTAVGRAGCNIEDIEIDHETEDRAILRLVLTDEGDFDALVGALEALGYEPRLRPLG
ncbi:MAG: prephenate dehydrogenase [Coriobacteriales bacterium]